MTLSVPPSSELAPRASRRGDHPLVVTLDKRAAARAVFSGDQLVEVDMPAGTRVVYPRPPMEPLKDADAAIRYALNHPLGSDPQFRGHTSLCSGFSLYHRQPEFPFGI